MDRAREFAATPPRSSDAASLEWLAERYEPVIEALLSMPRTVIHGEFYASNVLVAEGPDGTRVAPVDWELAAAAPGAVDLAALVSGDWPEADRERDRRRLSFCRGPGRSLRSATSTSPAFTSRSSGWDGRRRAGCPPRASATTGWPRRSSWPRGWAFEMAAERNLIVNADDFGLSAAVNAGILEAHERGIVTSTSLMVRKPAAGEAAALATPHASLAIGLHLDLGQWDYEEGEWRVAYENCPPDDPAAVDAECRAQVDAFRALLGRDPTHLDSHQHSHEHEPAMSVATTLAAELGLPLRGRRVRYEGGFYGQSGKGEPYPEGITTTHLTRLIAGLRAGLDRVRLPSRHRRRSGIVLCRRARDRGRGRSATRWSRRRSIARACGCAPSPSSTERRPPVPGLTPFAGLQSGRGWTPTGATAPRTGYCPKRHGRRRSPSSRSG